MTHNSDQSGYAGGKAYTFIVGPHEFQTHDPIVDARKILVQSSFLPADDHVLIQLLGHSSKSLGLDEEVDLRTPGVEHFEAFKSDRVFSFTIDGRGYEWGASAISEPRLRSLAHIPDDMVLILERSDEAPRELTPEDQLDLASRGTEHLRTTNATVTVIYNNDNKFSLKRGVYGIAELKNIFSVPSGYVLDVVRENGDFDELKDGDSIRIKDGMEFVSHAPCGQSS